MENKPDLPVLINDFLTSKGDSSEIQARIYAAVLDLLIHNTSMLYQVLYRIDVGEDKVKNAFSDNPDAELAAERITALIVKRQLEKIQWRQKYSGNDSE